MTKKHFRVDPYATAHRTVVASVDGCDVELESTTLFAFSGGQESDHGSIAGILVASARKEGRLIKYVLLPDHGLLVGQPVEVANDRERRHCLMRLHFAAELVLELFYRQFDGVGKLGAHIAQDKARIDFALAHSIAPILADLSAKANRTIVSDMEVRTGFDDVDNERGYWEIEGFSRVPCGGTHVRSTGEIGQIRLKRNNIGKGKERVEIFLDE